MTQLLERLSTGGPQPLLLYFAIPLSFATIAAASELVVLYKKETKGRVKLFNSIFGWIAAGWFCWVAWQLFSQVWVKDQWRGAFDFISMTAYIGCLVPLVGMAIADLPWVKIRKRPERRLVIHAAFSALFVLLLFVSMTTAMWNG